MVEALVRRILTAPPQPIDSVETWHRRHQAIAAEQTTTIAVAVAAAAGTDRLAWAFASGYQAAGQSLFGTPPQVIGALCATEAGGVHPRAIECRLEDGALFGDKTFVTFGLEATRLVVIASAGRDGDRNRLKAVLLHRDAPGVTLQPLPTTPFIPEISHASLHLEGARGQVLEGDGYLDYLKPFRTVEDVHVLAAGAAHIASQSRDPRQKERAVAAILALATIVYMPPLSPATHVALAGAIDIIDALVAAHEGDERWSRDRPLFGVAGRARIKRREVAWGHFASDGTVNP